MSCCGVFIMPTEWILRKPADTPTDAGERRLTGGKVLAMLLAFFGVVAAVNALMMTLAIGTMPGLDARNGYDPSQRYNAEIAASRAQAARGWRQDASVILSDGAAVVALTLTDSEDRPVTGLEIAAELAHPATRGLDRASRMIEIAPGRYTARVADVRPGLWTLGIVARPDAAGEPLWRGRTRLMVKG
jgi:nitrogen fixation protein FixH